MLGNWESKTFPLQPYFFSMSQTLIPECGQDITSFTILQIMTGNTEGNLLMGLLPFQFSKTTGIGQCHGIGKIQVSSMKKVFQ